MALTLEGKIKMEDICSKGNEKNLLNILVRTRNAPLLYGDEEKSKKLSLIFQNDRTILRAF